MLPHRILATLFFVDAEKRTRLLERLRALGFTDEGNKRVCVSLREFFDGNDDEGSIGCNLLEHPGVDAFANCLRAIEARDEVQTVGMLMIESMAEDDDAWPFSDTVLVLTSAEPADVEGWVASLEPDDTRINCERVSGISRVLTSGPTA